MRLCWEAVVLQVAALWLLGWLIAAWAAYVQHDTYPSGNTLVQLLLQQWILHFLKFTCRAFADGCVASLCPHSHDV